MSNLQSIKKRISNTQNVGKITKTMEMVAAVKMRHAQQIALASRPYALAALDLFGRLSVVSEELPPILRPRPIQGALFLLVASDKGLAGAFNSAVIRKFEQYSSQNPAVPGNRYAAVGEKAGKYLARKKYPVARKFSGVAEYASLEQTRPISDYIVAGYLAGEWDRVMVFSMHFRSALKQEPLVRELLPVSLKSVTDAIDSIIPETGKFAEERRKTGEEVSLPANYLIEPSASRVLEHVVEHLLHAQLYHVVVESNAAEHSARRAAMKMASDNAHDLQETLTLQYNKARQAAITKEIIEISAGAEALS
ncbi:MAG: ATP synthase F1 subunit gamma [Candidatus Saccharimonadales bacterium]